MNRTHDTLRLRFLAALVIGLFCAFGLLAQPLPAHAEGEPGAELSHIDLIHDDADILDDQRVVDALNQLVRLDADSDAQIAVYTSDEVSKDNYDEDMTELIKSEADPLIMEDGQLRENIIVVTISPEVRQLGVYAREGSALENRQAVEASTQAMVPYAKEADWDNTAFVGASSYLETLDIASRNDPNADTEERSPFTQKTLGMFLTVILGAFAILGICVLILSMVENAEPRRKRKKAIALLKDTSPHTLRTAYEEWEIIESVEKQSPGLLDEIFYNPEQEIEELKRYLSAALNPNAKKDKFSYIGYTNSVDFEELIEPRKNATLGKILGLHDFSTKGDRSTWNEVKTSIETECQRVRDTEEEMALLEMPKKPASLIRTKAEKTLERIDEVIENIESNPRKVDPFSELNYIDDLLEDFEQYAAKITRGLDDEQRAQMVAPRQDSSTSRWEDNGILFPVYAASIIALSQASTPGSSSFSNGSSSSYSTPTSTFSGGFSGGGFSGGSTGF